MSKRLKKNDYIEVAKQYDLHPALLKAIVDVESNGGFLNDGRIKILYEPHIFYRETNGKYGNTKPVSAENWTKTREWGYGTFTQQYDKLEEASKLDKEAAYKACSWGAFQLLGRNYKTAGYPSVFSMVEAFKEDEKTHLIAIVKWMENTGILKHLRNKDWHEFSRRYNGSGYKSNEHHLKMERAFKKNKDSFAVDYSEEKQKEKTTKEYETNWIGKLIKWIINLIRG